MAGMDLDLTGRVALVTGGSRGLGKAIASVMAKKGANIVICGRKQENLDQAVAELRGQGAEVAAFAANVGRGEEMATLFESIEGRYGTLDILVNNAGMNILTPSVTAAGEGLWDKIMATNLKGTFLASREAVPLMQKTGKGKIINISSIAARKAAMGMGIYCVAKAGVEMLTRVLAVELAQDHITVNAVAPAMVRTQFSRPFWGNDDLLRQMTATIPMGRIAEPDDVVGAVLFLASDLSDFVTGKVITVDGGSMA